MYAYQYHIPSAMAANKWNTLVYVNSNQKWAAVHAVIVHFRGSTYPAQCEVMLKKGSGKSKIRTYICKEIEPGKYEAFLKGD